MPRPKTGVTPVRNIRVAEDLWRPAQHAAKDRGETLTAVIERALRRYVAEHERAQRRAQAEEDSTDAGTPPASG